MKKYIKFFLIVFLISCKLDIIGVEQVQVIPDNIKVENSNYSEEDILFVAKALSQSNIFKDLNEINTSDLRLLIEEKSSSEFIVHIGSKNPYQGGSGATYSIKRESGNVELISTETFAPEPDGI